MKKLFLSLICIVCPLVPWSDIGAQTIYYQEGFENGTPTGWTVQGTASTSYNWVVSTKSAHDGSYAYVFNSYNASRGQTGILTSAPVAITSPETTLSFWLKNPKGGNLSVYISTDSGATYLNNPLDTNIVSITDWTQYSYSLQQYVGQTINVVFYSVSNFGSGDAYHYLDDFVIRESASCAKPIDVMFSNVTQTSAQVMWSLDSEGDVPSSFIMTVTDADGNNLMQNQSITHTVLGSSYIYDLTGLQPNSTYYVTIKGDCSSNFRGYSQPSDIAELVTRCNPTNLPLTADFDAETGLIPNCWVVISAPDNTTGVSSTQKYGSSGKSFKLVATTGASSLVGTQQFAHPANDMEVDFMCYASSGSVINVGLMTDFSDLSTFESLKTINVSETGWKNYRFVTSNSVLGTTQNASVVFALSSGGSYYAYIDNVDIHSIPTCLRLEDLEVLVADSTSIQLNWTDYSATASNNYVVEVTNLTENTVNYVNATTRRFTVTGLNDETNYSFRVRNVCSASDSSQWSLPVTGRTGCRAITSLPYLEDFESGSDVPSCWAELITGWSIYTTSYSSSYYVHSGSASLQAPTSSNEGSKVIAISPVSVPVANAYELNFWMYRSSSTYSLYPGNKVNVWVNTSPTLTGAVFLDSISYNTTLYPVESGSTGMFNYYFKIPLQGTVYVLFEVLNKNTSFYFDDITIQEYECKGWISDLSATLDLTAKTITATWNTKSDETQWVVDFVIKNSNDSVLASVSDYVTSTKEYTYDFSALYQTNSRYSYSINVRGVCGTDTVNTGLSLSKSFATPCEPLTLPISESFESTVFPPDCWSALTDPNSTDSEKEWNRSTSYHSSGTASASFPDSHIITVGYLNSPGFNATAGEEYQVSYSQYRITTTNSSKEDEGITIWLSQNQSDTVGAVKLGFVSRYNTGDVTSNGMYEYKYDFTVPQTGVYYIIVRATQMYGSANYVDDVNIGLKPSCVNIDKSLISIDPLADRATITVNDSIAKQIEIVVCGADVLVADSIKTTDIHITHNFSSTDQNVVVSGLQSETEYNVFWRVICDAASNKISDWSKSPISFVTKCMPFTINDTTAFVDSFEDYGSASLLINATECYESTINKSVYIKEGLSSYISSSGTQCVPFDGDKQLAVSYSSNGSLSHAFNLQAGKNYEVSIYSRLDKTYSSNPECASITMFYSPENNTGNVNYASSQLYFNNDTWTKYNGYFSVPTDGVYNVGFEMTVASSPNYIVFDKFQVREMACIPPTQYEIISITENSVDVQLTSSASQWEVRVCSSEPDITLSAPDAVVVDTVNTTSLTINSLGANTDYWFIVRSLCQSGASDWSNPIHFVTNCVGVNLPYSNSFENDSEVRCWRSSGGTTSVLERSTSRYNEGTSSMKVSNATAVSPKLNVTSLANYMITGWVYADQDSASTIDIGIALDPNDVSSYEVVTSITLNENNAWTEFVAYFSILNDADYEDFVNAQYVTIVTPGENVYYFDDIIIDVVPTCPKPSGVSAALNGGDVQLTWESSTTVSSWIVSKFKNNSLVNDTVVSSNSVLFTGLDPVTNYHFTVRAICSATDTSNVSKSNTVKTPCGNIALPYLSDFSTNGNVCWESYTTSDGSGYYDLEWDFSTYLGSYYISHDDGEENDTATLVTPTFVVAGNNGIELEFDGYTSYSYDEIYALYSQNGGLSWDTIPSFSLPSLRNTVKYPLTSVTAGNIQFKFLALAGGYGNSYIYAFNIEEIEDCTRPQNVTTTLSGDSAIVVIEDSVASHTQWQYVYGIGDFDPNTKTPVTLSSKTFTINGLASQTKYSVYVRTMCGATECSSWYKPYTFVTACGVVALPYTETFDDLDVIEDAFEGQCYSFYSTKSGSLTSTSSYPYVVYNDESSYTVYGANGSNTIKMVSSYTHPLFLQLPQFELSVENLAVGFYYRNEGTSSSNSEIEVGVMLPDNSSSFVTVYTCPLQTNPDQHVDVDFTQLLPAGDYTGYVVAFKYGPGSNFYYAAVDDITVVSKVKCGTAPSLTLNDISMDSINLNLNYYADSLQIKYGNVGTTADDMTHSMYVTDNSVAINGLSAGTAYKFFIRNICSGVEGDWSEPYIFTTFCDTIVVTKENAWVENFDNLTDTRYPECFYTLKSNTVNGVTYPTVVDTLVSTAPASLAMNGANIISLPLFSGEITDYHLSFYLKGSGIVYVGTVDGIDESSFTSLKSFTAKSTVTSYNIDLSLYTPSGSKLAFKSSSYADLYIDSVCVQIKPECFTPRNVAVSTIMDSSVTVSFQLSPMTDSFEYVIYSNTDSLTRTVTGKASSCTVDGLIPNTAYNFAVRTYCSDGNVSDWSDTISFTTARELLSAPFTLNFENDVFTNKYLEIKNSTSENKFIVGTDADAVNKGTKALYISNDNSSYGYTISNAQTSNFAILNVKFTPGRYNLSYDWKCYGESNFDYARVFFAPIDEVFNASTSTVSGISYSSLSSEYTSLDNDSKLNVSSVWNHNSIDFVVEDAISGQLVFFWRNDNSRGTLPPIAFDNIVVTKSACMNEIDSINLVSVSSDNVQFAVYNNANLNDSIGYRIMSATDTVEVSNVTLGGSVPSNVTISGLQPNTDYVVEFWGYCAEGKTGSLTVEFTTQCVSVVVDAANPFFEGFENITSTAVFSKAVDCWSDVSISGYSDLIYWSSSSSVVGKRPYKGKRAYGLTQYNERYISRLFSLQPGTYEISIWAEATAGSTGSVSIYERKSTDTADSCLVTQEIRDIYEPVVSQFVVTEAGEYEIGFRVDATTAVNLVIDNISVKKDAEVYQVSQLRATEVLDVSAVLKWKTYENVNHLRVADASGSLVVDTLITNGQDTLLLEGLTPSTEYNVSLVAKNASSVASDTVYTTFTTTCSVYSSYYNDFESESELSRPDCWELEAFTAAGAPYVNTSKAQWQVTDNENLQGRKALAAHNSFLSTKSVNIVYSPEVIVDRQKLLEFDYFNNCNKDSLVVSIVADGVESAPILVATTTSAWSSFSYDLSSYIGSVVKVKFWTRSYYAGSTQFIAIDNISIACTTPGNEYNVTVCPNTNFIGHGFTIPSTKLVVGDTTTFTGRVTGLNGDCDTINTIHIYVPSPNGTVVYDTICSGQVYNKGLFSGLTTSGRYTVPGVSSFGCDSNVVLYLSVIDVNVNISMNLCEGQTYNFAGKTITSAGVYSDTVVNARGCDSITTLTVYYTAKYHEETAYFCEGASYKWSKNNQTYTAAGRYENAMKNAAGCDSIEVLNLVMLPTNVYVTADLCQGQNYDFFGSSITEAGTYTHRLANSLGCDSIINLTVTMTPAPVTKVSDYVCEGQDYAGYGFSFESLTADTVATRTISTSEGCDSIVELTLDFIPTQYVSITVNIAEGESYVFGGNTLTQAGEYTNTFYSEEYGCDSIVTLTLTVGTAVDNAYALPIVVAPNPVVGGQSTFVNREWTAEEQNGMRVEVLNAVGQVVDVFTPTTFPIEVGGIYTSGVYYIRVTTGTGDIYIGRLVVK